MWYIIYMLKFGLWGLLSGVTSAIVTYTLGHDAGIGSITSSGWVNYGPGLFFALAIAFPSAKNNFSKESIWKTIMWFTDSAASFFVASALLVMTVIFLGSLAFLLAGLVGGLLITLGLSKTLYPLSKREVLILTILSGILAWPTLIFGELGIPILFIIWQMGMALGLGKILEGKVIKVLQTDEGSE